MQATRPSRYPRASNPKLAHPPRCTGAKPESGKARMRFRPADEIATMLGSVKQRLYKAVLPATAERRLQALLRAGRVTMGRHSYGLPEVVTFGGDTTTGLRIGHYV